MLISTLRHIKNSPNKIEYKYKDTYFLTNFQKSATNLVVLFHGGGNTYPAPIFRGYDYYFDNTIVLSISDPLCAFYKDINIGWYFDTKKHTITGNIIEIIKYIQNNSSVKNTLCVAQCSGSMIALRVGSILNVSVLITNPHLILKQDIDTFGDNISSKVNIWNI